MSDPIEIASAFITGAPPGELHDVVNDIRTLNADTEPSLISKLRPAFQTYNEEQLVTTKLPGSGQSVRLKLALSICGRTIADQDDKRQVLICKYNRLADGRYFDTASNTSFEFDHVTQQASSSQSYSHSSPHSDLINSLLKSLSSYTSEHYPSASYGVYPIDTGEPSSSSSLAILIVSNKYSPNNFWNGRWRSTYLLNLDPTSPSTTTTTSTTAKSLSGTIKLTVHYYEDGNVNLSATKPVSLDLTADGTSSSLTGPDITRHIGRIERAYQVEVNRAFVGMNEDSFKGLRRQLPVTRQKVEWEKVGGYRLGSDLRGAAGR